jgi:hypothetical protein
MLVTGTRMVMTSTVSLTATVWITNQSCSRPAAFFTATQKPVPAGTVVPGFDKFDMAVLGDGRYVMSWFRQGGFTMTPG